MRARRNSPPEHVVSRYMRAVNREPVDSVPRGEPQTEMPGMVTSDAAALLMAQQQKKARKQYDKQAAAREFEFQLKAYRFPPPFSYLNSKGKLSHEYRYCANAHEYGVESRDFRADYAWPDYRVLVEINGGIWIQGAHGHPLNIERDIIKQQYAALLGFFVVPITTDQVKNGDGIAWLRRVLFARGWRP